MSNTWPSQQVMTYAFAIIAKEVLGYNVVCPAKNIATSYSVIERDELMRFFFFFRHLLDEKKDEL